MDITRVNITQYIFGGFNIKDRLQMFIDVYGIDYIDSRGRTLLECNGFFTMDEIDLILSYKPKIKCRGGFVVGLRYSCRGLMMLERLLEYDRDFDLVTCNALEAYSSNETDKTILETLKMRRESFIKCGDKSKEGEKMIWLLENHAKRYYKLFDLLLFLIEDNRSNKKSRVY